MTKSESSLAFLNTCSERRVVEQAVICLEAGEKKIICSLKLDNSFFSICEPHIMLILYARICHLLGVFVFVLASL